MLKRELGLKERDIVDIPQLFKLRADITGTFKAEAFFPNMVRKWPPEAARLCQWPWVSEASWALGAGTQSSAHPLGMVTDRPAYRAPVGISRAETIITPT